MGFSDQRENSLVLAKYGNDVNQTLNELMRLKYFRDQQQQRVTEVAPNIDSTTNSAPNIRFHKTSKPIGNTTARSSVAASAKESSAKEPTLVIKKVPTDKKKVIADALRTKTQLVHFNNPSFVRDLYGPGLVCFANYTSSQDCDKAIGAMRDWFAKQDWAKRITLHVKK